VHLRTTRQALDQRAPHFFIGFLKMLKKILILALTVNTPYILSSHSSPSPAQDLAVSCAALVSGIICAWPAYKSSKKMWQTMKEVDRQIKILNDMGVKVYKVSKSEFYLGSIVIKEHYAMDIPSNFSQKQEQQAQEHWSLLLTNDKKSNSAMVAGLAAVSLLGSLILIPTGIVSIIECMKRFQ
jgi:hypothetical protein